MPPGITARNRPEMVYAWRGPSMLVVGTDGWSRAGEFQGYFFRETRYLHALRLEIDGHAPTLSSIAQTGPHDIAATYVHPAVPMTGEGSGTGGQARVHGLLTRDLDLYLRYRLHPASVETVLLITNRWDERVEVELGWKLSADFSDLDAAKTGRTEQRAPVDAVAVGNCVVFSHRHERLPLETRVSIEGVAGWTFEGGRLAARVALPRQRTIEVRLVARAVDPEDPIDEEGERLREAHQDAWQERRTRIVGPGEAAAALFADHAMRDLGSMALLDGAEEEWMAPAAGYPLYPSYWARDAFTAGWQSSYLDHGEQVEATLPTAARLQGTRIDERRAEEPGRIIRQHRRDPRARLGDTPFDRFYNDFSSPFMFILALGNAYAWSGKKDLIRRYWDNCRRVLDWARVYGDRDGDGYVEYLNPSGFGAPHEGWKDSGNAVVYPDGRQVKPPIAPAEIQSYWYAALQFSAAFALVMGEKRTARDYWREAKALKARFNRDFWVEEEGIVGFGLDSRKELIRTVVSNAGHCLTAGIIDDERLPRVVDRLFRPDMFSGWGIRTLSSDHPAYNPQEYHLGSVWAVENGTILFGLRRFGFDDRALELARALYDLGRMWDDNRIPEAVAGYARNEFPFPGAYPRANAPQAWNQSQPPMLVQALLGARAIAGLKVLAIDPILPDWLPEVTLKRLRVGEAVVSLRFWRDGDGRSHHKVLEREGKLRIIRQPPMDALGVGVRDRLGALVRGVLR